MSLTVCPVSLWTPRRAGSERNQQLRQTFEFGSLISMGKNPASRIRQLGRFFERVASFSNFFSSSSRTATMVSKRSLEETDFDGAEGSESDASLSENEDSRLGFSDVAMSSSDEDYAPTKKKARPVSYIRQEYFQLQSNIYQAKKIRKASSQSKKGTTRPSKKIRLPTSAAILVLAKTQDDQIVDKEMRTLFTCSTVLTISVLRVQEDYEHSNKVCMYSYAGQRYSRGQLIPFASLRMCPKQG